MLFLTNCGSKNSQPSDAFRDDLTKQINATVNVMALNGVVLLTQGDETIYARASGYSDISKGTGLDMNSQFVVGSISKQITAVLVLRAYENGLLHLNDSISRYLPSLRATWSDSVTIHHLLSHTHGIVALEEPLEFKPGSHFQYSQLGYELLAQVLESVSGKTFQEQSHGLFAQFGLESTFHPGSEDYTRLVKGYEAESGETLAYANNSLRNYAAAGSFISTAPDLARWNALLFGGKLLQKTTLDLMTQKHSQREHPVFGIVSYGYGIFFKNGEEEQQIGALGYAPGFVSACYHYPGSKLNLVVLKNTADDLYDFEKTFAVHTTLMRLVKEASQ